MLRLIPRVMAKLQATPVADADLEAAFFARDRRRTLALLMARHGARIYRYAMAMTHMRDVAEDVRQQVFVEAYRDLGSVADPASLAMWIFGIARHRCLDAVSALARWNQRHVPELPDGPEQRGHEPDRDLDRRRLADTLASCLARLAPAARDAVVLRYQQELSYDEAAAVAGDLPGTLQRRVARALPVLRRCVEATLPPGEPQ